MRLRKLLPMLLLLVSAAITLPAATPAHADTLTAPATTTITLHKLQVDISSGAQSVPNDGRLYNTSELQTKLGVPVSPLPGVIFEYWALSGTAGLDTLNPMTVAALDAAYPHVTLAATDAAGAVSAGALASFDNLGNPMRYYFREVFTPPNVHSTLASPFILGLPLMNVEGTMYLTEVHLYPKNVTVYGKVDLTKVAGYGAFLPNAHFRLYQGTAPTGTEYGQKLDLVTDSTGHLTVSGLPFGDYYFVETEAPAGFLLNPAPVPFSITVSESTDIVEVTKVNWVKPSITKWATQSDLTADSAGYNDQFTWVLQPKVPGNISSYASYTITDTLNAALTYTDNLVVKVGSISLTQGFHYTVSEPPAGTAGGTLQITLEPAQLSSFETNNKLDLINNTVITFTTKINNAAIMGQGIPNTVTVAYNDQIAGPGSATSGTAYAYTGGKVFKKVAEALNGTPLPGAQFKVALDAAGTEYVKDASGNDLVLTSDAQGNFSIKGLAYDLSTGTDYYLVETVAPVVGETPYNLLQSPVAFKVTGTSYYTDPTVITSTSTVPNAAPDQVINKTGFQIPQTGGLGTVLFTLGGLLLMGGAALLLRRKKGMTS